MVLELKGGELGPEGGIVALQFRAMPFQPPRLVLFGAELLFDERLLLAALVQRGPGLPRLVPAVHQVGGWEEYSTGGETTASMPSMPSMLCCSCCVAGRASSALVVIVGLADLLREQRG